MSIYSLLKPTTNWCVLIDQTRVNKTHPIHMNVYFKHVLVCTAAMLTVDLNKGNDKAAQLPLCEAKL